MNSEKELNLRLYIQREENKTHAPYEKELEFYEMVKRGEVSRVKNHLEERPIDHVLDMGVLSENSVRNLIYHFIVSTAMITRFCMEGGLDRETAYSLSDLYIQKVDHCLLEKEIATIHLTMALDFAARMKQLKKQKIYSKHIVMCIDYIYDHLHERITIVDLANMTGLNESYLSKLFKKETGMSVSDYIREKKVETAKNLLKFSNLSYLNIGNALAFSSQSHFIKVFHKATGHTPKEYQKLYYRSNWTSEQQKKSEMPIS